MGYQESKAKLLYLYDVFPLAIALVMGALMAARGSWQIYVDLTAGSSTISLLSHVLMAVAGVFIILIGKKDMVRTIGLYAFTLGLTRALMRYEFIMDDPSNILSMIYNGFMMLMALNLVYTGLSFARGLVVRRMSMLITTFFFVGLDIFLMLVPLSDLGVSTLDNTTRVIEVVMYIVLIIMLDSEAIRYGTSDGKHVRHLDRIRASYRAEPWAFITPESADNLVRGEGPMWREVGDGIVDREMVLRVSGRHIETTVLVQKWSGEDSLWFSVTPNTKTIVFSNKIKVDEIVRTEDHIHFYGRDGTDFVYAVKEALI